MKQITVREYAALVGKSRQWIVYCILHGLPLPEQERIRRIKKVGNYYVITIHE